MATDLERLIVQLEANTRKFEREMAKARTTANRELTAIERRAKQTNDRLGKMGGGGIGGLGGLGRLAGGAVAGLGLGAAANEVRKYADAWTEAGNRIKAAEAISGRQARSLSQLNDLAADTRTSLSATTELYAKLLVSTRDVAKSEADVAKATEIVNKSFKAGGAAASEQASAILQLSQALGSGVLQGDELRSLRENAPLLAQAIADEFGTTIAGLKQLGEDGALTTDRVFNAILKAQGKVEKAFKATAATTSDGFQALSDAAEEFIGTIDKIAGASAGFNSALSDMAAGIRNLSNAMADEEGDLGKIVRGYADILKTYVRLFTGQTTIEIFKDLKGNAEDLENTRKQLAGMFAEYRKGLAAIKPNSLSAFDDLAEKIDAGTISAEEAKKALLEIAGTDSRLQQLPAAFDPLIEKLGEVVSAAQNAAAAILSISEGNRAGGFSFLSERESTSRALEQRRIQSGRTDLDQKELEAAIDQRAKQIVEEFGDKITEEAAKIQARKEIELERGASVFNDAIKGFVDRVVQAESGGNASAKNPRSSATGAGQFIESTWLNLFRKHFPQEAANMGREAILALRNDAQTSRTLIEAYARENAAILQKAGVSVDEVALQLAHFLGPQGAVNVLKAAPGTPVSQVLDPGAVKANPEVLGGGATVEDVIAYAQARAGLNTVLTQENEIRQRNRQIVADMIQQGQEDTARITLETSLIGASNAEREKEIFIFERLNELKREGIPITDELLAQVESEANARFQAVSAYDAQAAAADRLQQAQEELAAVQQEVAEAFKGALKGFINDLIEGKSLTEALGNALGNLADRLIDIALDNIFASLFGGKGGGGILGSLFGFKKGGIAAHGRPKAFAGGGISRSAAIFGEAGPEAAVPLPDGRRIPVELRLPKMRQQPAAANSNRGGGNTVNITVITPDAPSFLESQNQIATKTAATMERTMRTR